MDGDLCRATPGCQGTIEEGYCSLCGKIDAPQPQSPPGSRSAGATNRSRVATATRKPTTRSRRSVTTAGRTTSRSRIGAGLVSVPPIPTLDPIAAVMSEPMVAEGKRFCGRCGTEVGRSRNGTPGRISGYCSKCQQPFSFIPPLGRGDLVGAQYRIAGCLAYGGLGWIYLAQDERVSNRWVVLKGLLNSGDPDAMAAALAERQFLARVEHPNVVRIYNFVQHGDAGYIVMEYVGGRPLREVLRERRQEGAGPLPVDHAAAYILGILPALGYLHRLGLVYNDFKPDNVMLQGDDVKLIDLGAVTRLGDGGATIYGTDGYQAPEVASEGPSVASDLYAVARCLATLVLDFRGYQDQYQYALPDPGEQPLFARHESLYRFLCKGTAESPDDRFQTADEMADQLLGVLREEVALRERSPRPAASTLFGGDLQPLYANAGAAAIAADWRYLPPLKVNPADAAASFVVNIAGFGGPDEQVARLREAIDQGQIPETPEAKLGIARALIWLQRHEEAESTLSEVSHDDPWDWRVTWYRGVGMLTRDQAAGARQAFERLSLDLPGELAPKMAEALAAELAGDPQRAAVLYDLVSTTDPGFTSTCFGLARVREALGDRSGAIEAYGRVPELSTLYVPAQVALVRTLIRREGGVGPGTGELAQAASTVERLGLEARVRAQLTIELLEAALAALESGNAWHDRSLDLLGHPFAEIDLRRGLERAYRDLARLNTGREKIRLVDRANQVRPVTPN